MIESVATTSEWIWDSIHCLYYNPTTTQYASPQSNGTWIYSEISTKTTTSKTTIIPSSLNSIDTSDKQEEDLDGEPYTYEEELETEVISSEEDRWSKVPILRIVVTSSTVIPSAQNVALVDPSEAISFGRDRSHTARVRLKELEVSKTHSVLFWLENGVEGLEESEGCWGIADSGSMHGTYLQKQNGIGKGKRLSESKVASAPFELNHLDCVTIGTTRLTIHIHSQFACEQCTVLPDSSNLVPLHSGIESTSSTPAVNLAVNYSTLSKAEKEQIRRDKMKGLKNKYSLTNSKSTLKPNINASIDAAAKATTEDSDTTSSIPTGTSTKASPFVDRSAARRVRDGASSKPTSAPPAPNPFFQVPNVVSNSNSNKSASVSSLPNLTPINPFDSTSRGAQLLAKMSSTGTSTSAARNSSPHGGSPSNGLGSLIQAKTFAQNGGSREEKPGLGSRDLVIIGAEDSQIGDSGGGRKGAEKRDWREVVRDMSRKRFKEME